jgi:hypothetical protein
MSVDKKAFPAKDETWWMKMIRFFDTPMRAMVFGNHKDLKRRYDVNPLDDIKEEALKDIEF